ncbi:MAG: Trehalase [Syntrophus sp. PtaU1.Bin208]|nr:MAG: Trehalase [Syntrophus sp. PtaU1.Bin208]
MLQNRDTDQIARWVTEAFAAHVQAVQDAISNPRKLKAARGFLTGQVMKLSGGQADPRIVGELIEAELAKIAARLGLSEREAYWKAQAELIHAAVCARAWNDHKKAFTAAFEGDSLDASLLLMHEVGFLAADDFRFAATVAAIERELRHGDYIFRYVEEDDFGAPENAFIVCTYWYIHALVALGRNDEARLLFENLLSRHNRHGLFAEHLDIRTGEQWGNFVQTYSMVGLIHSAIRLSKRWDAAF